MKSPNVFIIESLGYEDEKQKKFEGKIIQNILNLPSNGKTIETEYIYIRTIDELKFALKEFRKSNYRYLHISCHGNEYGISTTLNRIDFSKFGEIINQYINGVRLFFSSCSVADYFLARSIYSPKMQINKNLSKITHKESKCISVIGPKNDIGFRDAAIAWVAFYHLMFKKDSSRMKNEIIKKYLNQINHLFDTSLKFYDKLQYKKQNEKIIKLVKSLHKTYEG